MTSKEDEELQRLIEEQQRDMRNGSREWPDGPTVPFDSIGLFLDSEGRPAREGNFGSSGGYGGRVGDRKMWKLKTGTNVPRKGCRKYPKEHGQLHMFEYPGGGRRCGLCHQEYEAARRVNARLGNRRGKGPQCGHDPRQFTRIASGHNKGNMRCLECGRIRAKAWRERKKNGEQGKGRR